MSEPTENSAAPRFVERPTEFVIRDAFVLGALPLALAGFAGIAGWTGVGFALYSGVLARRRPSVDRVGSS